MGLPTALPSFYRALTDFVWGVLVRDTSGRISEIERALSAIRGFSILGFFAVAVYGAQANPTSHLVGASIALLGAAGAFAIGAALGFLFGLPRWSEQAPPAAPAVATSGQPPGVETLGTAATVLAPVRHNTGLEKVMDWLTTLIVGLGLVHLRDAYNYATDISIWLTRAISGDVMASYPANGSAGGAIILAYVVAGFFLSYLWAQRYMPGEMAQAERDSREAMKAMVRGYAEQVFNIAAGSPEQRFDVLALKDAANPLGLDKGMLDELAARYGRAIDYFDEPMASFGPSSAHGYSLEAQVRETTAGLGLFSITLSVRATEPGAAPLEGDVVFFLHHTLPECIRRVPVRDGEATLMILSAGSFIAGAALAGGKIRLSLNLAELPGVSMTFRQN